MQTFWQWLSKLRLCPLDETYFTFDPKEYNQLFDQELGKVIARTSDPAHCQALERMRGFNWVSYIGAAVRNSGCRDYREGQERIHEIAAKLVLGGLFRDYDERRHGPMDLRFKRSVGNAIRNLVEKERNRRHHLPTMPIQTEFEPGAVTPDDLPARSPRHDDDDGGGEKVIMDFRRLVKRRLGDIGTAVLDVRLAGGEVKSLVGRHDLGSPGKWGIKRTVQQIKELLGQYAASLGDAELLRRIDKAMEAESDTIQKRRTSTAARQAVGA